MTDLTPTSSFDPVPQLETTTLALAGPGAPMNFQAQALTNRTEFLKDAVQDINDSAIRISQYLPDSYVPGVTDASPYFTQFFADVKAAGASGRVESMSQPYFLQTNVLGDYSQIINIDQNATFSGPGILFAFQKYQSKPVDSRRVRFGATSGSSVIAIDDYVSLTNTATGPGYGHRQDYFHTGTLTSGFSLGKGNICVWQSINGGAGEAEWVVATTPTAASGGTWGVVTHEHNIMNRGPDTGYKKTRGENTRWAGGILMVPESDDLAGGTGNTCRNALYAFCSAHSSNFNNLGLQCKFYNAYLVEKDSVGPAGRGVLASGDTSGIPGSLPAYGLEVDQRWQSALYTVDGIFTGGIAINLGDDQILAWGTGVNAPSVRGNSSTGICRVQSGGTGGILMATAGGIAISIGNVAGAVNFLNMFGNTTGTGPTVGAAGADTNIDLNLQPKGTGQTRSSGSLRVTTAGRGLVVTEGANAKQGVATLVAGSVVVANTSVTATSRIFLTSQQDGGTPGFLRVSARTAATSFTITSSNAADTSIVAYEIFEAT